MRKFLLVIIFFAAILHFLLHYIVQMSKSNWVLDVEQKKDNIIEACFNQNFRSLLQMPKIHPFLCSNYLKLAQKEGSRKIDLPYGIRNGERYFKIVFSKLKNCELPPDIQMNNAPVVGYEADVGRKTTFRLCYPESIFSDREHYDPNTTIVLVPFKPYDVKWLSESLFHKRVSTFGFWRKPALKMMYTSDQIRVLNPVIFRKAAHELLHFPTRFPKKEKPKHPTTGIIAITFALHICNEVHIAGFKYNFTSLNSSLHYYGNETMSLMSEGEYHNISAEQMLLKDWVKKKIIINLTPD